MPEFNGVKIHSVQDTKNFWQNSSMFELEDSMYMERAIWLNDLYRVRFLWNNVSVEDYSSKSVLDVGCGNGLLAKVVPLAMNYLGIDINESFVNSAENEVVWKSFKFKVQDVYDLLESDDKYSYVAVTHFFGLFPREEIFSLLPKLWDKCTDGLYLTVLHNESNPMEEEFNTYSIDEITNLLSFNDISNKLISVNSNEIVCYVWKE